MKLSIKPTIPADAESRNFRRFAEAYWHASRKPKGAAPLPSDSLAIPFKAGDPQPPEAGTDSETEPSD